MPLSVGYRGSLAPRNVSNQVQGACPLWGQFFICKIKNGGLDNEMGMSIEAERKCPCPLWGLDFLTYPVKKSGGLDNA